MPAPVLEAPAKVEETKLDERGREAEPGQASSAPLFGAIAAADPAARPVTRSADLRTKTHVMLRVQRSAGNRAATDWIESMRAEPVTVARSACCDGCASGGACSSSAVEEQQTDEHDHTPPPLQRTPPDGDDRADEPATPPPPLQRTPLSADGAVPVQRGIVDDAGALLSRVRSRASSFVASIRAAAGRVWDRLAAVAGRVGAALRRIAASVVARLGAVFTALRQRLDGLVARLRAGAEQLAQRLRQGIDRIAALVRQGLDALRAGVRALLERIRSVATGVLGNLKAMGRATFGPMTGKCLDAPAAEGARARFDGLAEPAESEVGDAATAGLADLTAQFDGRDAAGAAEVGAVDTAGTSGTAQLTVERDALTGAAEAGRADVEGRGAAAMEEVRGAATGEVTGVETQAESGAADVESQKSAGAGGLSGLLGGIVAAIAGTATQVVSAANRDADSATTGLRGRFRSLVNGVRDVVDSVLGVVGIDIAKIVDQVAEIVRSIRDRINAVLDTIIQSVRDLVRRGRAALADLRARWRELAARAAAGWRSLRGFVSKLRTRASAALLNTCGDACALDSAKREGRQLDAAVVPQISFKAARGGARRPAPDRITAIQRELEDGGEPLPLGTRAPMEAAFGADLSATRVHTGATAAGLASGMNARAFTIGDDIAFGHGEFQPGSIHGDALIAHEVAHVLQQRRATGSGERATTTDDTAAEHDADHSAFAVVARMWAGARDGVADIAANAGPRIQSGLALRRCPSSKCCETPAPSGPLAAVKAEGNIDNPRPVDLLTGKRNKEEGGDVYGLTGPGYGHALRDMINTKSAVSDKCEQTCKPSVGQYPTFSLSPFFFVAAGRYPDFQFNENTGQPGARNFTVAKSGPCKGKSRPRVTIVTDALAAKVKAAEVEHAKDLAMAWDLSIGKYIAAVKELEGGFCVDGKEKLTPDICTEEFRTRVSQRSGINWAGWTSVADCLGNQSKDRDTNKWHTVSDKTATKVGTKDCEEVEVTPDATKLTEIGTHDSKEIVGDNAAACGAGGGP